jgi:hypothetical protein
MLIDFQYVNQCSPRYELNASDVPFFVEFLRRLNAIWPQIDQYSQIDLALYRYAKESAVYGDPVDLVICLEALLVPENECVAHHLSVRLANLLGPDAASRKELFRTAKDFYNLRSKIVHGAEFKHKELRAAEQLDALREITRRAILSVMAIAADIGLSSDTYELLNHMCVDDDLRHSLQAKASTLLHC